MIDSINKIVVRNTSIVINDYELGDSARLEYSFRVNRPTHDYYYLGLFYDEKNKRLFLPRGIDIYYLENIFGVKAYIDRNPNKYDKIEVNLRTPPRSDKQKEALRFMIGVGEYAANKYASQIALNLNTGVGKTYCSVATFCMLGVKPIIITSTNSWLKQWKDRILEYTDMKPSEVYHIDGSMGINMVLSGRSKTIQNAKVFTINHSSITAYGSEHGWEKITELFETLRVGFTIYDEAHLNFVNICMIDYFTNVYRAYYVTATLGKSDENEDRIYQLYFKNVPKIELFDEETDTHTGHMAFKYNSLPSPMDISNCKNMYGLNRSRYIEYLLERPNFYKMLRITLKFLMAHSGKYLFYIGTNEGILKVYHWLQENYPEIANDIGIYTSIISPEEKEIQKKKRFILTTYKSAGAALDIKGLKATVILAEPFKSPIIARQILGRTRDNDTICIEFVDLGFRYTKKYYYAKLPTLNKYALYVKDHTFMQAEIDNRVSEIMKERAMMMYNSLFEGIIEFPSSTPLIEGLIPTPTGMVEGLVFGNEQQY